RRASRRPNPAAAPPPPCGPGRGTRPGTHPRRRANPRARGGTRRAPSARGGEPTPRTRRGRDARRTRSRGRRRSVGRRVSRGGAPPRERRRQTCPEVLAGRNGTPGLPGNYSTIVCPPTGEVLQEMSIVVGDGRLEIGDRGRQKATTSVSSRSPISN